MIRASPEAVSANVCALIVPPIVVGTYRGNPIYNVIKLKAKYSSNVEGEDDDSLEDRILEGEQLLFAKKKAGNINSYTELLFSLIRFSIQVVS